MAILNYVLIMAKLSSFATTKANTYLSINETPTCQLITSFLSTEKCSRLSVFEIFTPQPTPPQSTTQNNCQCGSVLSNDDPQIFDCASNFLKKSVVSKELSVFVQFSQVWCFPAKKLSLERYVELTKHCKCLMRGAVCYFLSALYLTKESTKVMAFRPCSLIHLKWPPKVLQNFKKTPHCTCCPKELNQKGFSA